MRPIADNQSHVCFALEVFESLPNQACSNQELRSYSTIDTCYLQTFIDLQNHRIFNNFGRQSRVSLKLVQIVTVRASLVCLPEVTFLKKIQRAGRSTSKRVAWEAARAVPLTCFSNTLHQSLVLVNSLKYCIGQGSQMFAITFAGSVERAFLEMDLPEKPLIDHEELGLDVFCTSHGKPLHCQSAETVVTVRNKQDLSKTQQVQDSTGRMALLLDGCHDWAERRCSRWCKPRVRSIDIQCKPARLNAETNCQHSAEGHSAPRKGGHALFLIRFV